MIQNLIAPVLAGENFMPAIGRQYRATKPKPFWILKRHFLQLSNMNEQTFDKQKSKYSSRFGVWDCEKRDGGIYIDINSIPNRSTYLTTDDLKLKEMIARLTAQEQAAKWAAHGDEQKVLEVHSSMFIAKGNFPLYFNQIKEKYTLPAERCKEYAERWAVWVWILENYTRYHYSLEIFFTAYSKIFPNHFKGVHSKVAFKTFHGKCAKDGIEQWIIDKRAVTKIGHRRPQEQVLFLQTLYTQSRKITAADAARKLAAAFGAKAMSKSNVKIIFREFENNIELYAARYGAGAAQKQLPYASLRPADDRNTQWQIDGWTMPFWGEKFQRYVLYLVRDNHSRKIVGWSIAETENTTMILEALEDAMRGTNVFPAEIVSDKHSFHKTEIAARLRAETERMGAIWIVTINAQRNQLAERYNQYLDAICKDFAGYTGKNVTAKGKDARPSPEALTEMAKPSNWKTAEEIKAIAAYAVLEFNRGKMPALEGLSPNEKYEASENKKCFAISEAERVRLVRPIFAYKVERGQINVKVGAKKHEYQLPADLISKYNNKKLIVAWEDLSQGIYISDPATGEDLGCIAPKRKISGATPDQTEQDKKIINQLTGRANGVTTKARKKVQARIAEGLRDNPEAIELINTHALPKDIRQLAIQDSELKRAMADQGINANLLPIRAKKDAIEMPVVSKTKDSPFATTGTMEKVTLDEFSGNIL